MSEMAAVHKCYRCVPHEGPVAASGSGGAPVAVECIEATHQDSGEEVFFTSGYSAREIAQKHAQDAGGRVYVNTISRRIRRRDLTVPVLYAVAGTPVYTLRAPDALHAGFYRAYWPPLES